MDFKKEYTAQKLAIEFYNINWVSVQCDHDQECEKVKFLLYKLEKFPPSHAIRILLEVLEVMFLDNKFKDDKESPFANMNQFNYLNDSLNNWSTKDYTELEKR